MMNTDNVPAIVIPSEVEGSALSHTSVKSRFLDFAIFNRSFCILFPFRAFVINPFRCIKEVLGELN